MSFAVERIFMRMFENERQQLASHHKLCLLSAALLSSCPIYLQASTVYVVPRNNGTVISSNAGSHNLIIGSPGWSDRLLFDYFLHVPKRFNQTIRQKIVYPHPSYRSNENITAIQCWDQKKDGTGAHVIIQSGGVGKKNVTIEFVSQKGHGIKFIIKIFGR